MFSLYPAFFRVLYSTAYGIHTMTIPINQWTPGDMSSPSGYVATWNLGIPTPAEPMLEDLLNELANFVPTGTNFGRYTVFTKETPVAPALPRYNSTLNIDGLATPSLLDEACQLTFHWKTINFNDAKLVLLDATRLDGFNKILNPLSFTNVPALEAVFVDLNSGWRGRDGQKPQTLTSITATLNRRLRRANRDA